MYTSRKILITLTRFSSSKRKEKKSKNILIARSTTYLISVQFSADPLFHRQLPKGPWPRHNSVDYAKLLMFGDYVRSAARGNAGGPNETELVAEESRKFPYRIRSKLRVQEASGLYYFQHSL